MLYGPRLIRRVASITARPRRADSRSPIANLIVSGGQKSKLGQLIGLISKQTRGSESRKSSVQLRQNYPSWTVAAYSLIYHRVIALVSQVLRNNIENH
jgi:hypothetical protein